jgi:exopolysaccharide biosynthesis protein
VNKLTGTNPEHGVCFSESGQPTVENIRVPGPELKAGAEILQVVPNAYLEDGKEYNMSVFVKDGEKYHYSETQTIRLEAQPAITEFVCEQQDCSQEGVEVFKTTSQLNGRNFNAWYAIADPKQVDFKVLYPETVGSKKTVSAQAEAAGDCLVLMNGAIYGNYNIGVIITEGKMTQQWHGEIEGCYWGTDSQLYHITRPIIGTDKNGKAGAYWVGVPQQGTFYYYDRPQPSVTGQAKYGKVTSTSPVPAIDWDPYYAISCGPMVLYDGKVCADNSMVDDTHYYTNFECWDESGVYSAHPDRSAVGMTEDGKIVLFICDGRIDVSQGAYIKELGPIMKSIGCVHAMNLDGGGSTGMWVAGSGMINHKDDSWRAVKSTLGFFKK